MPAGVLLLALVAQAVTTAAPDAAELQRIRTAFARPPTLTVQTSTDDSGSLVFRVKVRGWKFDHASWHDDSTVPLYVRPSMPPVHFEFLQQVTNEFFRSSVLYPGSPRTPYGGVGVGVPLVPLLEALGKRTKALKRRAAEEAAREEVRQALAAALACRAYPSKPGC